MVEAYPEDEEFEDGWGEGDDGDGWDDDVEDDN